ncbi:hypothetical protein OH76DRAFT_1363808 [Lentinus brumalis]|uniref:BTB domain-containing protein n=1 Tax=Lentinus brumalis TaxID=2498619 RepID=A0A371CNF4_9APHY|nr:hypothetical protein OH76DRAFT_1363808 [Polyporus brumalis]
MGTPLSEIHRDPDVWFEDGNIIVIAQQTAFCFHRGTLAKHSEIFCSLFTVPQPTSPDTMDGCPVICVTDTPYDFKFLLRAIYDGVSVFATKGPMNFSVLAALVRMGHKYEVESVLDESLRRLGTVYTTDFAVWNEHQHEGTSVVSLCDEDAVEAINLFRLTGQSQMLPSAFYACARLDISEILAGMERADGTLETLSAEDLELLLEGRTELVKYDAHIIAHFFKPPLPVDCTCPSVDLSRTLLANGSKMLLDSFPSHLDADVLGSYFTRLANSYCTSQLCRSCVDALAAHHFMLRRKVWDELPNIFDIEASGWGIDQT